MLCCCCFVRIHWWQWWLWRNPQRIYLSLNNSKGLAPFMSNVKPEYKALAIYRHSDNGPAFGDDLVIDAKISKSRAHLGSFYSIPTSVKDKYAILKGPGTYFLPDKVEVFYLDPSR